MASLVDQFQDDLGTSSESDSGGRAARCAEELPDAPTGASVLPTLSPLLERIRDPDPLDADGARELLSQCADGAGRACDAAAAAHARLRAAYAPRFPELGALLRSPAEYSRVARTLGNDVAPEAVSRAGELSPAARIAVQVAASTSAGRALAADEARDVVEAGREIDALDEAEAALLRHVEANAAGLAPNLVVLVGGAVAARLIGAAGGLSSLAFMPGCTVKGLGRVKAELRGGSAARRGRHDGLVHACPRVVALPESLRSNAGNVVANKVVLAARVDVAREAVDGALGQRFADEVEKKFEKWQEPPPARTAKPLPVPGEIRKKHRAGRRARKQKELYGTSEMRKQANRVKFGQAEAHYGNDVESGGLGLLGGGGEDGGGGSGKLRVAPKNTGSLGAAANRRLAKHARRQTGPSAAAVAGLTTTVQGIELGTMTPAPGGVGLGSLDAQGGTKSVYFAPTTGLLAARDRTSEKK